VEIEAVTPDSRALLQVDAISPVIARLTSNEPVLPRFRQRVMSIFMFAALMVRGQRRSAGKLYVPDI
jgi:hypothetical protein